MIFNLEIPINRTGLGQVGFGIAHEMFQRNLKPNLFPISQVDLSPFDTPVGMTEWLQECSNKALETYNNNTPSITLWHIGGSHKKISKKNILWTVHETDRITRVEKNIISQYDKVLVTSNYSKDVFAKSGVEAAICPNFFDKVHFSNTEVNKKGQDGVVNFGLFGKMEHRKLTIPIMIAWANRFGFNEKFRLNCVINNSFLPEDRQKNIILQAFQGRIPWNFNFIVPQEKNSQINQIHNLIDVDITGLSGAEGWNLPAFHSLALGKQCLFLDAHAHKDYANESNSILVEPSSMNEIYDGMFFNKGEPLNQGLMYNFSEPDVFKALDRSLEVAKVDNEEGKKLQQKFTVAKTVDILLNQI